MLTKRFLPLSIKLAFTLILIMGTAEAVHTVPALPASVDATDGFNIWIVNPVEGSISDNDLSITATITSTFELSSVKAQIDGREVSLAFSSTAICSGGPCSPGWSGAMSLAGLTRGPKTLTVTATDVFGNSGQSQRHFIYDQPPRVTATNPVAESVTGLTLHVTASCADDDAAGCKSLAVTWQHSSIGAGTSGTLLQVNQSSIDQDVTLPATVKGFSLDGSTIYLGVRGTDSAGQERAVFRTIYIQQNSRLIEEESFKGRILDVQPERVLLLEEPGVPGNVLKIRARATGEETAVPLAGKVVLAGFLSPKGAVFVARDPNIFSRIGRVYDWRDETLIDLGEIFTDPGGGGLKVKGDYLIWDTYNQTDQVSVLLLRNLSAGTTTELAKGASAGPHADVAANGDVVYTWAQNNDLYNIYRYRNGVSSQLTNDAQDFINGYPVTDGVNVVYQRKSRTAQTNDYTTTLYDASGARSDLTSMPRVLSQGEYQAAGGWVGFPRLGGGVSQIWTRSPTGDFKQVSFFGTNSFLKQLSSNGELTFNNSGRVYLFQRNSPPLDVAAATPLLITFSLDSRWYAFLGRTLFHLPSAAELAPVLLTDGATGRALALDSATHLRDPFAFSTPHNFSTDQRTRVRLFGRNVDWSRVNANMPLTVQAEDAEHRSFSLKVEYAAPDPILNWLAEIIVRLPDELSKGGDLWVTVNVGGFNSNQAKISITGAADGTR